MPEMRRATADDLTDPVLGSLTAMIGGLGDGTRCGKIFRVRSFG